MCDACNPDATPADKKATQALAAEGIDRIHAGLKMSLFTLEMVVKNTAGTPDGAEQVVESLKRQTNMLVTMLKISTGAIPHDDALAAVREANRS